MAANNEIVLQYSKLEARIALIEGRECDKYDYMIATFCGVMAGVVDSVFLGKPNIRDNTNNSILGREVDKVSEWAVEKFADVCISKDTKMYNKIAESLKSENLEKREFNTRLKEELIKHGVPENFSIRKPYTDFKGNHSKLTYLENKFHVSYDQSNSSKIVEKLDFTVTPDNHHLKGIAHWPDYIGLIVSIADQFTEKTTFINNGEIVRITPNHKLPPLRGETFIQKIFFGFVNWIGHLFSDFCGSHSSTGRGDGIPIPFFGLFLGCDFGSFHSGSKDSADSLTISELAVKVYESGYDARFGATMAIPVLIQDLMIRFIWALKARFVHKKPWKECIPTNTHKDLRMMLLVGNASLCIVDGADAIIRSKGNIVEFVLHLNMIAWYKLAKNALKEICIRFDFTYEDLKTQFEYLDYQLELYIQKLKSVNYVEYERNIFALNDISEFLVHEEWNIAVERMDAYILRNKINTDVKNCEDFRQKLIQNNFEFKIGGKTK